MSGLRQRTSAGCRALRGQFTTPALILSIVALILALAGGAYAAGGGLSGKQKKEVEKIAKKFQGTGPAGATGANGTNGANGTPGTPGKDGTSVTGTHFADSEGGCTEGGVKFESASGTAYACNGTKGTNGHSVTGTPFADSEGGCTEGGVKFEINGSETFACNGGKGEKGDAGETGFTETLPPGKTETGTWSFFYTRLHSEEEEPYELRRVPISFPIPLATPPSTNECGVDGSRCQVHRVAERQTGSGPCAGGTALEPKAAPGNLCIYEGDMTSSAEGENFYLSPSGGTEVGESGLLWAVFLTPGAIGTEAEGYGSWAVTAPTP